MSETLKDLRKGARKSVGEVAEALGVTDKAIYNYENGSRSINIAQVLILAELYNCTEREVIEAQLKVLR